jgi:HD-GYP domain-containing protein (c-di-GMP phosphodiesterase class II)
MNVPLTIKRALRDYLAKTSDLLSPRTRRFLDQWFRTTPFTLKSKLILLFSLLFIIVIFGVSLFSLKHQKHFLTQELENRARLMANNLAVSSRDAVLGRDLLALSSLIGATQKDEDVVYAYVVDHRDVIIMHSDVTKISAPHIPLPQASSDKSLGSDMVQIASGPMSIIEVSQPIEYGNKTIGSVFIGLNQTRVERIIGEAKSRLLQTMGWGLALGGAGILLLSHLFLRPVAHMVRATQEVASGNLEILVPVNSRDELGQLGDSFNFMTAHLRAAYQEVERGYMDTTRALAAAVEAKDPYTKGHCERVRLYALEIGVRLGLSKHELKELELAAILHDIGKIGIRDDILTKPYRLSYEEMRMMHLHPEIGKRILEKVEPLHHVAMHILSHHEFINGKGYPQGLKGEKIPVISRIITVADSYDSMSSYRPYRGPLSEEEVHKRLIGSKGRQFDPPMVDTFLELCNAGVIENIKSKYPGDL